jgi:SWIM zinc finger
MTRSVPSTAVDGRWEVEQVVALASSPRAIEAAEPLARAVAWDGAGCDERAVWGRYRGGRAEPYEVSADHVEAAWACTCPSRQRPCKHVLALLLAWVRGEVAAGVAPERVRRWLATTSPAPSTGERETTPPVPRPGPPPTDVDPTSTGPDRGDRDDRIARLHDGLRALEQWLDDRMRLGLADPSIARASTWDDLAARLVDSRAGALANRVRRVAGLVGVGDDWHAAVLDELGLVHLLARGALGLATLPDGLDDAVALATGWQVRQADVLAGVPDSDRWHVLGRSDAREDRIEVRRCWLRGERTGRWAMLLSFAAFQQALDTSLVVGTTIDADLHRYPGSGLRALLGRRAELQPAPRPAGVTIADGLAEVGAAIACEPWLERHPTCLLASVARDRGRLLLTDVTGSVPLVLGDASAAVLVAAAADGPLTVTVEWTPRGMIPLTIHLDDRAIDVGPTADPSFVAAA